MHRYKFKNDRIYDKRSKNNKICPKGYNKQNLKYTFTCKVKLLIHSSFVGRIA